jgi:Phosphatidylserine synthase
LFGYMASGKTYLGFLAGCLYVLCALIRLAYFNVLEEERQQVETGGRSCYLGLPVTSVALLLPAFLVIGKQLSFNLSRLLPVLLIGMAAAFVLPLHVKKPRLFGKIGIVFTGIVEFVILLMGLGMEI